MLFSIPCLVIPVFFNLFWSHCVVWLFLLTFVHGGWFLECSVISFLLLKMFVCSVLTVRRISLASVLRFECLPLENMSFSLPEVWVYPPELLINCWIRIFFSWKVSGDSSTLFRAEAKAGAFMSLAPSVGCTGFCVTLRVLCGSRLYVVVPSWPSAVFQCWLLSVQWSLWIPASFLFLFVSRDYLDLSPWLCSSILRTTILGNILYCIKHTINCTILGN